MPPRCIAHAGAAASEEERIRAKFFVTSGFMPRCHSCQALREPMPKDDARPTGREDAECVPCGCLYDEGILEMFLVDKGIIPCWKKKDSSVDKDRLASCSGRRKPFLMGMFEQFFGDFNMEKLFDGKIRAKACAQVAKNGNRKPVSLLDGNGKDDSTGDTADDDHSEQSEDESGSETGTDDSAKEGVAGTVDGEDDAASDRSESGSSFFSVSD